MLSDATASQATLMWIVRDGISLLGGLLFTTFSSYNFGQNVKIWRLLADSINNVGITLEMIAPHIPQLFLPIICIASLCKAMCGIAAGATGAVICQHWGEKHGNVADVLAKNGAQHTVVSIIGLVLGMQLTRFSTSAPPVFTVLCIRHSHVCICIVIIVQCVY